MKGIGRQIPVTRAAFVSVGGSGREVVGGGTAAVGNGGNEWGREVVAPAREGKRDGEGAGHDEEDDLEA